MTCYAFFDTDILYHYPILRDIDWLRELTADTVVLVYAPIIARQLNRHKDNIGDHRRRKKAGDAIRRLEEWLDHDPPEEVRPGVLLTERTVDPVIDFPALHLNKDVEDDWLLATAIEFKRELPDTSSDRVVVITGDRGLAGKARHQPEIEGLRLREDLRLPEAEDPTDREMRELRQQLRALEHATPKLSLGFRRSKDCLAFVLQPSTDLSKELFEDAMAAIREEYPEMRNHVPDPRMGLAATMFDQYTTASLARYNKARAPYFSAYARYLAEQHYYQNWPRLTLQLPIKLFNTGTAPADDVTILLTFPEGYVIQDDETRPSKPKGPKPPPPPRSRWEGSVDMDRIGP